MLSQMAYKLPKDYGEFPEQGWTSKDISPKNLEYRLKNSKRWFDINNQEVSDNLSLTKLAKDVETQLVPLTPTPVKSPRWSNIGEEFIGDGKYNEVVYQSPIKTSAGDVHFAPRESLDELEEIPEELHSGFKQQFPNYFSHIRYEDMADGRTRKILETQSDLMQKEVFESERALSLSRKETQQALSDKTKADEIVKRSAQ